MILIKANESSADRRRVYFQLVDATDGMTPETGEAGQQPQVSVNGGAWTSTGIGTLSAIGHGRYTAELSQTLVATAGLVIETRYKSGNTAECPGDSVQVVAFDPHDAQGLGLDRLDGKVTDVAADVWDTALSGHTASGSAGKALGDAGSGASAADIADAVWDEALSGHSSAGTAGNALAAAGSAGDPWSTVLPGSYTTGQAGKIIGDYLDAAISSRSSHSAADVATAVWAASARTLTAFSFLTSSAIAAAVWDEDLATHTTADSAGASLTTASSAGDPWAATLPGSYTAGQAGHLIGQNLDAKVSSRSTYAGGDTPGVTTLLSRLPDTLSLSAINAEMVASMDDYDALTKAEMESALAAIASHGDEHWATAEVSGVAGQVAEAVLAVPENKLVTDATGRVAVGSNHDKAGYSLADAPPSAATVASAVWDATLSDHAAPGSAGQVTQATASHAQALQALQAILQANARGER